MIKKFTKYITSIFIPDHHNINDMKVRAQFGALEGWTSIIVNTVLFAIKISIGISLMSISLIADAIHTLADSATSIVIIIGFKIAKKPSDKNHPFGHGRMESISALIVSVLLFVAGLEILKSSIYNIITPTTATASWPVILLITATLFIKWIMARFAFELGETINSSALKADAIHHKSDVFATGLVVVALIAARYGFFKVDGIMGVMVSFIIIYSAYTIAREAIDPLLGEPPSRETLKNIEAIAMQYDEVHGVHDIICHNYGNENVISLHIEVSDKDSVVHLHAVSEKIEEQISKALGGMAIVHIDPINRQHPQYKPISKTIHKIISQDKNALSFHELRIVGQGKEKCNVIFDIVMNSDVGERETSYSIENIKWKFLKHFPDMKVYIKAEPKYVCNLN